MKTRPVKDKDGRTGTCECRKHGYTITWSDGTTQRCVDTSYIGAEFTDLKRTPRGPDITPPKFA